MTSPISVHVDVSKVKRVTLDVLGVFGALAGLWCLVVHADLVGAGVAGAGGAGVLMRALALAGRA